MNFKLNLVLALFLPLFFILGQRNVLGMGKKESSTVTNDSLFVPNQSEGWSIMSSYLSNVNDSVAFELILSRNVPAQNDWGQPSLIGSIDSFFAPGMHQTIEFNAPTRTWTIIVIPNGKCYLKLKEGRPPGHQPCIIPFQIKYKK